MKTVLLKNKAIGTIYDDSAQAGDRVTITIYDIKGWPISVTDEIADFLPRLPKVERRAQLRIHIFNNYQK